MALKSALCFCLNQLSWGWVGGEMLSTAMVAVLFWKRFTLDFNFCLEQKIAGEFSVFLRLQMDLNDILITVCAQPGFWTLLLLAQQLPVTRIIFILGNHLYLTCAHLHAVLHSEIFPVWVIDRIIFLFNAWVTLQIFLLSLLRSVELF